MCPQQDHFTRTADQQALYLTALLLHLVISELKPDDIPH